MRARTYLVLLIAFFPSIVSAQAAKSEPAGASGPFFTGFSIAGEYSNWYFYPISQKMMEESSEDQTNKEWQNVDTYELYDIDPLHLYKISANINTRIASLSLAYESNVGLGLGYGNSFAWAATLGNFASQLLKPLSFEIRHLMFRSGSVQMKSVATEGIIDEAVFAVDMIHALANYHFPMKKNRNLEWLITAGYRSFSVPRGVYLQHSQDSGSDDVDFTYYKLPVFQNKLWQVSQTQGVFGGGVQNRQLSKNTGWRFNGFLLVHVGTYDLGPVGGDSLYDDLMIGAEVGGTLGYEWKVGKSGYVGLRDRLSLTLYSGFLPSDMEEQSKAMIPNFDEDDDGVSLAFGSADVFNNFFAYFRMAF